ncbi:hypothetical protein PVAP13_3NG141414 [Panicum virgatum]|uniref:Uncharacterized protein n=1 Tax=Panicum virgatum TaxID=38727 RepID=A0A8T0UBC2_PANVG|nr:hypothetical protein PVAP13_3NG141414 [Panicum virgatum]KAG2619378.1 hypothetical protein PVAP13_3NG141414 [Panicum virgatum]KAG2619380.1 hypothetical protein PVAP13_3NG141414 [Panicum virgatum]
MRLFLCMQVSTLLHADRVPRTLAEFLGYRGVRFVGVGMGADAERLSGNDERRGAGGHAAAQQGQSRQGRRWCRLSSTTSSSSRCSRPPLVLLPSCGVICSEAKV